MQVQKLRLRKGWSQEQLATVSGLSVRTIQRIESGENASLESQKALASVLEVEISDLQPQETEMVAASTISSQNEEALAFAHVRRIKRFYVHLMQYAIVITALFVINFLSSPQYIWAVWPALGWGVGVAFHGLLVFDKVPFLTADWEKRMVERKLGRPL
jgi:transcriptional regulator with XRE-family HTH domain